MKIVWQLLCLVLIAVLLAMNGYRAATQSVTIDEAMTYNRFVWPPLSESITTYDANNHILQTLLCKVSVRAVGLSEFGLRLPSLFGGLLFLFSIWRLVRLALGRGAFCFFGFAAIVLNPFVLDYLSAARGYGLALGFFFWGLFLLARYLAEDHDPPKPALFRAGVAFSLAVASNLVFLVPVCAAGGIFTLLVLFRNNPAPFGERFWTVTDRFWGPALVPAFVVLVLPLARAEAQSFYYGAKTFADMLNNLTAISLTHTLEVWALAPYLPGFPYWMPVAVSYVIPALAVIAAAVAILSLRRTGSERMPLLLVAGTLALAILALVAANLRAGVLYPLGRTGVYLPPLFTLAVLFAVPPLWRAGAAGKAAATACCAVFVIAMGLYLAGFTVNQYPEWRYDAGTKRVVQILRERHRANPRAHVRIGCNWLFECSLNFYRHRYRLDWIEPVTRAGIDGTYDYYLYLPQDAAHAQQRGLRPLYRDPVSEATLAIP